MFQPHLFGDYLLLDRIGVGGMAEVFLARHKSGPADDYIVIKRLLPHLVADRRIVAMFSHEAKISSSVKHRNVVRSLDWGAIGPDRYIAQEYVPGLDLQSVLKYIQKSKSGLSPACLVHIFGGIANGLAEAHEAVDEDGAPLNTVHRDVTPENLLVSFDGNVKITDFGIATSALSDTTAQDNALKGKTRYISPEQSHVRPVDARADIFSLGAVLFEAIEGQPLFDGPNNFVVLESIRAGEAIRRPSNTVAQYPPALIDALMKALAHDREQRYQSCREFAEALQQIEGAPDYETGTSLFGAWLRVHFPQAVADLEDRYDTYARYEVLDDGQVIEHAPPAEDATSQWDLELPRADGPPTAAMRVVGPVIFRLRGTRV